MSGLLVVAVCFASGAVVFAGIMVALEWVDRRRQRIFEERYRKWRQKMDPGHVSSMPSRAEMRDLERTLSLKLSCHDQTCRAFGRHRCHNLSCANHRKPEAV